MMLTFRAGTTADADDMAALEARATLYPWLANQYREALQTGYFSLVMTQQDEIYGHVFAMQMLDEAEILNFAIEPTQQGKGRGRQLLDELLKQLQQSGTQRVFLEVRENNHRARRLYLCRGFIETGRRKNYYPAPNGREDAILMEIVL